MITSIESYSEWRKGELECNAGDPLDIATGVAMAAAIPVALIGGFISKMRSDKARAAKVNEQGLKFAEQLASETKRCYQTAIQKMKSSISKLEGIKREAKSDLEKGRERDTNKGAIKQIISSLIDDGVFESKYEAASASAAIHSIESKLETFESSIDDIDTKVEFIKDYVGAEKLSTSDAKKVYAAVNYLIKKLAKVNKEKAKLYTDRFTRLLKV